MFEPQNRKYLHLVLDSTPDGITVQRPDGSLAYVNASAARLLGFESAQEFMATPIPEILARFEMMDERGNPFPAVNLPGRHALQGNPHPEDVLLRFHRANNDKVEWCIVAARPVFDDQGDLIFVVNTFRHVTDTMQARQAERELRQKVEQLQEAERRFRTLLESAPDAMVIVGQDGRIQLVNSQAEALFGYSRAELIGMPVEHLAPVNLRDLHSRHRQEYAREPRTRPMGVGLDLVATHKDGREIPVEISLSPMQNAGEALYIAAIRDVSERRRAQEQLRRSETQLAMAQSIAHLGSWEWDIRQNTFFWSKEMERIFNVDADAPSPSFAAYLERVHPEDRARVEEAVSAAYRRGIPFSLHHRVRLANGVIRAMQAQGTVETDGQGNVVRIVGTSQDITMQKEIDEELRRSEALYRAMAENLPNGSVLVVDGDMRYQLARGSGLDIDISSWEGRTLAEVAPDPQWLERVTGRYRQVLQGQAVSEERERNGRVFLIQSVPLVNVEGDVYAALTLVQSVTEQREAERTTQRLLDLSRDLNATLNTASLIETLAVAVTQLARADHGRVNLIHPKLLKDGGNQATPELDEWALTLRVPVVSLNGETLGYLEAARQNGDNPFDSVDQERLKGLAQIAAIALQNALSFQHLRTLGQQLVSAQEAERRSLSRELHDSTGQILMALKMSLTMLQDELTGKDAGVIAQVEEIAEMVDDVYEEIRAVSHALRPPSLEVNNIDEALKGLCEDYARHSGLNIQYNGCHPPQLPEGISISLYRLLQEALTNVAKHAAATKVEVRLQNGGDEIELSVFDDGVGFALEEIMDARRAPGVGLVGLQERFELLGGRLKIESTSGQGTHIAGIYRLQQTAQAH